MKETFKAKNVAGATRFNFETTISRSMFDQLIWEFSKEYQNKENSTTVKMLNKEGTKGLEISRNFILFFPELNKNETIQMRERIYKNIASKAEIYLGTSKDDIRGATSSLLANNLRSSASLLYYAIHKYTNSKMYSLFNKTFELEQSSKKSIKELEHFTSGNFYAAQKHTPPCSELSLENYKRFICTNNKLDRVNPFLLLKILIRQNENNTNEEELFGPYINLISKTLFNVPLHEESLEIYKEKMTELENKRKSKSYNIKHDMIISIGYCLKRILKSDVSNNLKWKLYILTLRIYWLRQMADYEYDFDVRTSLRELSTTLDTVKKFINMQEGDSITTDRELNNNQLKMHKDDNSPELNNAKDREKLTFKLYNIDFKFPLRDYFDAKPMMYLTAIHLEADFSKETIFRAMNFMKGVSNYGKYFKYSRDNPFYLAIYLHISDVGRWTVWASIKDERIKHFTKKDLLNVFTVFISDLEKTLADRSFEIVASRPVDYDDGWSTFNLRGLHSLSLGHSMRKTIFKKKLLNSIPRVIGNLESGNLMIGEIAIIPEIVHFNPIERSNLFSLPHLMYLEDQYSHRKFMYLIIKIIDKSIGHQLNNNLKIDQHLYYRTTNFVNRLVKNGYFSKNVLPPLILCIDRTDLDDFLSGNNQSFVEKLFSEVNQVSYKLIKNNRFSDSYVLLWNAINTSYTTSYHLATKAFWYLRNWRISDEESERMGKYYYEKALEFDYDPYVDFKADLEQKYYFELAKFYSNRVNMNKLGREYLDKAFMMGRRQYWDDIIKFSKEKGFVFMSYLPDKGKLEVPQNVSR